MRFVDVGTTVCLAVLALACSSASPHGTQSAVAGDMLDASQSNDAQASGLLGGGTSSGDSSACAGGTLQGCPCAPGSTVSCWTGPIANRNKGSCHDGMQTCGASQGEATQVLWGPCVGEILQCGATSADASAPDSGPPDATVNDAMPSDAIVSVSADATSPPPDGGCTTECIPGAVVWCAVGNSEVHFCSSSDQYDQLATETCQPNGSWGPCVEGGKTTGNCADGTGVGDGWSGDCTGALCNPSAVVPGSVYWDASDDPGDAGEFSLFDGSIIVQVTDSGVTYGF